MKLSTCGSCAAPVIWAVTVTGKTMPVDPTPAEDGNLWLVKGKGDAPVALKAGDHVQPERYKSHFATCPNADQHRAS